MSAAVDEQARVVVAVHVLLTQRMSLRGHPHTCRREHATRSKQQLVIYNILHTIQLAHCKLVTVLSFIVTVTEYMVAQYLYQIVVM